MAYDDKEKKAALLVAALPPPDKLLKKPGGEEKAEEAPMGGEDYAAGDIMAAIQDKDTAALKAALKDFVKTCIAEG